MSIHPSLKTKSGALNQHRNVLTRAERIERLTFEGRFDIATKSVLGTVMVRSIKATVSKKPKKEAVAGAEGAATPAAGAKPAAGANPAAGAKPAAAAAKPAAGAKPAAKK